MPGHDGLKSRSSRNLQLDILRLAAVLLVFFRHTPAWIHGDAPRATRALVRGGWAGVDLFFVLSGFLIGGLLFLEYKRYGKLQLKRFYIRRGLKLYPAFYIMIASTLIVQAANHLPFPPPSALLGEMFFLQNYVGAIRGHTWSLAVEEHFYILLPLLLIVLFKTIKLDRAAPRILTIYICVALITATLRWFKWQSEPFTLITHLFPTHLRIDSLLCGVTLAYFYHFHSAAFENVSKRFRWPLLIGGVAAFTWPMLIDIGESRSLYVIGLPTLSLGGAALIAGTLSISSDNWVSRALAFVGASSYSIYLYHLTLFNVAESICRRLHLSASSPITVLLEYVTAAAGGIVIGEIIEFPVLKIRDRFFPSRTGVPVTASGANGTTMQSTETPTHSHPTLLNDH